MLVEFSIFILIQPFVINKQKKPNTLPLTHPATKTVNVKKSLNRTKSDLRKKHIKEQVP